MKLPLEETTTLGSLGLKSAKTNGKVVARLLRPLNDLKPAKKTKSSKFREKSNRVGPRIVVDLVVGDKVKQKIVKVDDIFFIERFTAKVYGTVYGRGKLGDDVNYIYAVYTEKSRLPVISHSDGNDFSEVIKALSQKSNFFWAETDKVLVNVDRVVNAEKSPGKTWTVFFNRSGRTKEVVVQKKNVSTFLKLMGSDRISSYEEPDYYKFALRGADKTIRFIGHDEVMFIISTGSRSTGTLFYSHDRTVTSKNLPFLSHVIKHIDDVFPSSAKGTFIKIDRDVLVNLNHLRSIDVIKEGKHKYYTLIFHRKGDPSDSPRFRGEVRFEVSFRQVVEVNKWLRKLGLGDIGTGR